MSISVLLVGSGGREHALAWKLAQSSNVSKILIVPGNGGTASLGQKVENVSSVREDDFAALLQLAISKQVNLLIPGPEAPLVHGIKDYFEEHGPARIKVFGPSKAAAQIEGSKTFSKEFMERHAIPTGSHRSFTDHSQALKYIRSFEPSHSRPPFVVKADGLAAGKGVVLPQTYQEAVNALSSIMVDKAFGSAGGSVLVEEFLDGEEISILSFSDGHTILSLPPAQDHKRVNDGDQGLNTGGMGAYAPCSIATPETLKQIQLQVLQPTIDGMRSEGIPFVGCLFTGLMLTSSGPKVVEYNARFGDPECQTLIPLLNNDLSEIMLACTGGYLSAKTLSVKPLHSTTVVVAAGGYPGSYAKGTPMTVHAPTEEEVVHFHAGTSLDTTGLKSTGGRVIACTSLGPTFAASREKSYRGVQLIQFEGMHYRKDIGRREVERREKAASSALPQGKDIPLTYEAAGVSIDNGEKLVQMIKPLIKSTRRAGADAEIGGFAGLLSLSAAGYGSDSGSLVCCVDGIGSKLLIAVATGIFDTVGIDLVAMNVNDLVVAGAEPLAFLDYYATSKLDVHQATSFIQGVVNGCRQSNCVLIGGETAEMPGLYNPGDFDASGTAIGILGSGIAPLPDTSSMKAGDILLGLASSGLHSNGFSLVRKLVERAGLNYSDAAPWEMEAEGDVAATSPGEAVRTVGQSLLEPTRIYVKSLLSVLPHGHRGSSSTDSANAATVALSEQSGPSTTPKMKSRVLGLSHITGGGILNNANRMLPPHLSAFFEIQSWPVPPVLRWMKRTSRMSSRDFAKTFNCGLGMVLVVPAAEVDFVKTALEKEGERVWKVGALRPREGQDGDAVILEGLKAWDDL